MYLDTLSLKINESTCKRCGICVRECVNNVLVMDEKTHLPTVIRGGEARCIHCAHCLMACPSGAFSMDSIDPAACPEIRKGTDFQPLLHTVQNRRSIRHYQAKNVDRAVLADLYEALRYVPTGVNYRKLHFTFIDDVDVMNEFRKSFYKKLGTVDNDMARQWVAAWEQGRDIVFRTAPHMVLAAYDENSACGRDDAIIALTQFEMLANACGIGTVWFGRLMTIFAKVMPESVQDFRLPDGCKPGYAMLFGYAANRFYRNIARETPSFTFLKKG